MRLAILLLLLAQSAMPLDADRSARIGEYMQAQVKVNHFSGTILLARQGKPLVEQGYGMANAELGVPNGPRTKFRIGSITKQFTSMTVMRLEQEGKLKVQDPICQYLTACPDAWKPITIQHLLTHTSGIPSYTDGAEYGRTMMMPKTVEGMVAEFRDKPLEFTPGSQFKYDNSGYFLLGVIIQNITHKPYEQELADEVLTPLGLKDTGYDHTEAILPERAAGYVQRDDRIQNAAYLDMVQPFSAGALYSTVEDLLAWDQSLYTDRLLPQAARDAMFTPFRNGYAYGWTVAPPSPQTFGHPLIEHGGGINGFSSMIVRVPDEHVTAIVLSNLESGNASRVAHDLLAIYYGRPVQIPKEHIVAKVDPAIYDAYVGRYQLAPTFVMAVTREGDRLMVQATGQGKIPMFPESETTFFSRVVDAQITFEKDAAGKTVALILRQNGRDQRAPKVE